MKTPTFVLLVVTLFADSGMAGNAVPAKLDALLNLIESKTIFVASPFMNGDLGGLAGADQLCQDLADASSMVPEGEYVALLSTDDTNAASRITPSVGPYIRPDGLPIAANFTALFNTRGGFSDHDLVNIPDMDEQGNILGGDGAWTGTDRSGKRVLQNCDNWTNGTGSAEGRYGFVTSVDSMWLDDISSGCDLAIHIYCVQR